MQILLQVNFIWLRLTFYFKKRHCLKYWSNGLIWYITWGWASSFFWSNSSSYTARKSLKAGLSQQNLHINWHLFCYVTLRVLCKSKKKKLYRLVTYGAPRWTYFSTSCVFSCSKHRKKKNDAIKMLIVYLCPQKSMNDWKLIPKIN